MKIPCSVGILTFNNENTLEKAMDSVKNFEEIIICDGGSTDRTLEIAKMYNCNIIVQNQEFKYPDNRIADFSGVRNQMLKAAGNDWFLYLDSDEFISNELKNEICNIINDEENRFFVFNVPRKYILNGEMIDWASTYPNYQVRFFHRQHVKFFIKKVHERIDVLPYEEKGWLVGYLLVPHESDVHKLRSKYDYYLKIQLEKFKDVTFKSWLHLFYFVVRSTLGGIYKVARNIIFHREKRLPLNLELIKWSNNINLICKSLSCISIFQRSNYKKSNKQ